MLGWWGIIGIGRGQGALPTPGIWGKDQVEGTHTEDPGPPYTQWWLQSWGDVFLVISPWTDPLLPCPRAWRPPGGTELLGQKAAWRPDWTVYGDRRCHPKTRVPAGGRSGWQPHCGDSSQHFPRSAKCDVCPALCQAPCTTTSQAAAASPWTIAIANCTGTCMCPASRSPMTASSGGSWGLGPRLGQVGGPGVGLGAGAGGGG